MTTPVSLLLRRALLADAIASGASGALLSFDAAPLAALFGLPASLLQAAGIVSLAWACSPPGSAHATRCGARRCGP